MPKQVAQAFTARQASALTGLRPAMVNYLCRSEVVVPTGGKQRGRGRARRYTFGDVVILRSVAKMLRAGFEVSRIKLALSALRRHHPSITPTALPADLLVTDGTSVFFRKSAEVIEELNRGQFVFGFVLELATVRKEIVAKINRGARA